MSEFDFEIGSEFDFEIGDLLVNFRPRQPSDDPVIYSAWLRGHRAMGDWPRRLSSRRYFDTYKRVVAALLERSETTVACSAERPDQVFGFATHEGGWLHWVYVKQIYEKQGLMRHMVRDLKWTCTHWTKNAQELVENKKCLWKYDPFVLDKLERDCGVWAPREETSNETQLR